MLSWMLLLWVLGVPDGGVSLRHPIEVKAEHLQVQAKLGQATWTGNVRAKRGATHLTCDRLVAHYRIGNEITHLECFGNVEVVDGTKWAKGERADFNNETAVLVVTGNPEAREGKNHMRGTKVIFDVAKDTLDVEKAQAIFETKGGPPRLPRVRRTEDGGAP
ncbi:MAG: LptA/OstA family protein [Myxococcaceae bacterium]